MASIVNVSDNNHQRSIAINGDTVTVKQAVAQFYDIREAEVAAKVRGASVRLINFGEIASEADWNRKMAPGDTVTIYPAAVATGGVKGAKALPLS